MFWVHSDSDVLCHCYAYTANTDFTSLTFRQHFCKSGDTETTHRSFKICYSFNAFLPKMHLCSQNERKFSRTTSNGKNLEVYPGIQFSSGSHKRSACQIASSGSWTTLQDQAEVLLLLLQEPCGVRSPWPGPGSACTHRPLVLKPVGYRTAGEAAPVWHGLTRTSRGRVRPDTLQVERTWWDRRSSRWRRGCFPLCWYRILLPLSAVGGDDCKSCREATTPSMPKERFPPRWPSGSRFQVRWSPCFQAHKSAPDSHPQKKDDSKMRNAVEARFLSETKMKTCSQTGEKSPEPLRRDSRPHIRNARHAPPWCCWETASRFPCQDRSFHGRLRHQFLLGPARDSPALLFHQAWLSLTSLRS